MLPCLVSLSRTKKQSRWRLRFSEPWREESGDMQDGARWFCGWGRGPRRAYVGWAGGRCVLGSDTDGERECACASRGVGRRAKQDPRAGKPSCAREIAGLASRLLAIDAERDCRNSLCAILDNAVARLLDGSMTEKMPYVASMNFLQDCWR
jgi:hypothetical protein